MGRWLIATGIVPGISGDNNIEVTKKDTRDTVSTNPNDGEAVLPGIGYNNKSGNPINPDSKVEPLINAEQSPQDCNQQV